MQTTLPTDTLIQDNDTARARRLAAAKGGADERGRAAAKKVAREFESVFIGMMLKSMRETVGKDPIAGGGKGEEIFQSLLDQEYATAFAARGGIGLAPMIEKQLIKEPAAAATAPRDPYER
ncbi:rod-binding protein [Geobacter pickeringii]|uniref:rod-binding protein n=1 Tax=Geobacter pickeringii TaxID=345632 RepID=UPI00068E49E9|nr:rod-binding protein [Geobacter pickeringii]